MEDVREVFPRVKEGKEVQPPSTPVIMRAVALDSVPLRDITFLFASVAPGSSSSSLHYSRLKFAKAIPSLMRFPATV